MKPNKGTYNGGFRGNKSQCSTYVMKCHFMSHEYKSYGSRSSYCKFECDIDDFVLVNIIIIFMIWGGRSKEIP